MAEIYHSRGKSSDLKTFLFSVYLSSKSPAVVSSNNGDKGRRLAGQSLSGGLLLGDQLRDETISAFHGFRGLPVEFEFEVPCRAPSARNWMKEMEDEVAALIEMQAKVEKEVGSTQDLFLLRGF
ncbi:RNA-binding (RRM/RBD/RNP motifs) family protein [Actinidia rufa]|uniref:RNA-binding (RRM/RBD/RNP motifs) family protein n=1 Tax=Actinidia rufa TaxID=165716 RepID=A0A7J0DAW3_9ERIC|nr:RNA-binding (RRM/RBD/RNP motifs) family protein [Actinidia rufa]